MEDVKVLSICTVFPNPAEEELGLFVRNRLQYMASLLPVRVVAPVPVVDYAARGLRNNRISARRHDQELEVYFPRWFYPPHGNSINAFFLAGRLLPYLRRLSREYPFQVIDAHFGCPEGIAAALLGAALHCPFTITLRGNETMHAKSSGKRRWMSWALSRAARVITVSESLREFAISLGAETARVCTIPNGIDTAVFFARPYGETRARLGIPVDRPVILSAGYLIERKGHHRVVQALNDLRRGGSNAELWIVGGPGREGNFSAQIHVAVKENGLEHAVHFTGSLKPAVLAEYMSAADVFCLASTREGWPNVVHEALGCGAPVVASDVGGVRDMIPSADYGLVVPVGDQPSLTAALGKALRTEWDRGRVAAWGQSRSWTQVAAETANVLREAAAEGKVS